MARLPDWQNKQNHLEAILVECLNCGLIYQNPRPTQEELTFYYPEEYVCYQKDVNPQQMKGLKAVGASYGMRKRCQLVLRKRKQGRLLDVGCATGVFLEAMHRYPGWELFGVEINATAAQIGQSKNIAEIIVTSLEKGGYPDAFFDVITLWDVFEHMIDPSASLRELVRILKPDGTLIMRVPNGQSWEAKLLGRYWAGYEPPRHLYVFDPNSLGRILQQSGMQVNSLECNFGGYLVFLLGIGFRLADSQLPLAVQKRILVFLGNPIMRLFMAPLFWLLSRNQRGPLLDVTATLPITEESPYA